MEVIFHGPARMSFHSIFGARRRWVCGSRVSDRRRVCRCACSIQRKIEQIRVYSGFFVRGTFKQGLQALRITGTGAATSMNASDPELARKEFSSMAIDWSSFTIPTSNSLRFVSFVLCACYNCAVPTLDNYDALCPRFVCLCSLVLNQSLHTVTVRPYLKSRSIK